MTWHVFFDTTELVSGHVLDRELGGLVAGRRAAGFVPQLAVDELVFQTLRSIRSAHDKIQASAPLLGPYLPLSPIEQLPPDIELMKTVRSVVMRDRIPSWLTVIPTYRDMGRVLDMSLQRMPPFRGEKNPTGFHDAVILLSAVQFAADRTLTPCIFVSGNIKDFSLETLKALTRPEDRWLFLSSTQELVEFLRDPELADAATRLMSQRFTVLEDYIRVHLLAEMLSELREHFGFAEVSKVERLRISTLSAALDPPFQREGQAAVKFHALVNLVVEGTSMPVTLPGRITRETSGYFGFSLTVTGRAALTLRAGKTVGPPTFLSAEVTSITDESGNAAWQPRSNPPQS